ncbi:hypothetical protein ACIP5Y_46935 [Nocardia sp. NPDC088792]|uniref:hypothetical protein n=1 Tax=Nocardia sp. NPDC088792 TaxID=3364332 RepID=UPI0037F2F40C
MRARVGLVALATGASVTLAVACGTSTANAAPQDGQHPEVGYHAVVSGDAVVTTIDTGRFTGTPGGTSIVVTDDAGRQVGEIPLAFALAGLRYGIQQSISDDGRTVRLAPDLASAQPVASPLENSLAANDGLGKFGLAAAVGPLVGAVAGALVGVVVALASCAVLAVGCLVTGLPIIGVFAGGGALAGTVLIGGSVAAWAAGNYLGTLTAPPGQSPYAKDGFGTDQAGVPDSLLRVPRLPSGSSGGSSSGSGKH